MSLRCLGWKIVEELARTTTGPPKEALTIRETMHTLRIRNEQAGSFNKKTLVEGFKQGLCTGCPQTSPREAWEGSWIRMAYKWVR
jgi:hypothetical protein